jgi:hypothetical protein
MGVVADELAAESIVSVSKAVVNSEMQVDKACPSEV